MNTKHKCDEPGCKKAAEWKDAEEQYWCEEHRHSLVARIDRRLVKKFTIVCSGDTEDDLASAFDEAVSRIKADNTSGGDKNDNGAFYFDVSDVPPNGVSEIPAT